MPDVKMPDGTVVRFPDGMPSEQIRELILQKFPDAGGQPKAEEFGITDTWPFRLTRGLVEAGKDAATLPGDVFAGKQDVNDPSITPRALGFAAFASPLNPAVRAGDRAIAGVAGRGKGAPTAEALTRAGKEGFEAFRKSGIKIKGEVARNLAQRLRQELEEKGITEVDAPSTYAKIKMLESAPEGAFMSAANFHATRKAFGRTAGNFANPTDRTGSSLVIDRLDQFLAGLTPQSLVAGTPAGSAQAAKDLFRDARGNFAAGKRSDTLTGKLHAAELRAQAANSGRNLDNAIRQRMAGVALQPKSSRGFTPEEVKSIEGIVEGGRGTNAARFGSNLLGGGGGLGAMLTSILGAGAGGFAGGPVGGMLGAGAPILGFGLKGIENLLSRRAVGKVDEATRARSPLAEKGATGPAGDVTAREALLRALLLSQLQNPNSL